MVMYLGYFNKLFSMDVFSPASNQEVIFYFCSVVLWTRAPSPNPTSAFRSRPKLRCCNVLKNVTVSQPSDGNFHPSTNIKTPRKDKNGEFPYCGKMSNSFVYYSVSLLLKYNHLNVKFPNL